MKLTKDERHTAYIILLAEAEHKFKKKDYSEGLCELTWCLEEKTKESCFSMWDLENEILIENDLPELSRKLTRINRKCFYELALPATIDGWQKRIELLKQCIEETANF